MKFSDYIGKPWYLLFVAGLIVAIPLVLVAQQAQKNDFGDSPYLRIDPDKIVTTAQLNPCGECHTLEKAVWDTTAHAKGFDDLHRRPRARQILKAMGLTVSKRESLCLKCHYTADIDEDDGVVKAVAGVSCESCHGAARDWITVHDDVRDARAAGDQAHVQELIDTAVANGMLRPSSNLYAVAANCFECHTVPHEKLVNVGGHTTGSASFDLVAQYQKIKHDYVEAQRGGSTANRPLTQERKRMMFVVGRMLDYEYNIRGVAKATESDGIYLTNMVNRTDDAFLGLEDILLTLDASDSGVDIPEVKHVLEIGRKVTLEPDHEEDLLSAADQIRALGQQFTHQYDGSELSPLDPLLAGEPAPRPAATVDVNPQPSGGEQTTAAATDSTQGSEGQPSSTGAPEQVSAIGPVVNPPAWFPHFDHAVTQPGCNCHVKAVDWLQSDRHSRSAAPFIAGHPKAVQIANLYGLTAQQMVQAGSLCMNCHSTFKDRSRGRPVRNGVTCEGCHGPAEVYARSHLTGGNPKDGMRALKQAGARAANCSRCHYITDQRLLSAGHPTGDDYDFAEAVTKIVHWPDDRNMQRSGPYPEVAAAALRQAFQQIKQARPIPSFTRVEPPASTAAATSEGAVTGGEADAAGQPAAAAVPGWDDFDAAVSTGAPVGGSSAAAPYRSPLAGITDSTATEDILLILKQRLQRLYQIKQR